MGTMTVTGVEAGQVDKKDNAVWRKTLSFTDGNPADGVSSTSVGGLGGLLVGVGIKFGTTAPNTLTVTIADDRGCQLYTTTVTATGRGDDIETPIPVVGGLSVALSGNTTASATATIDLYLI